MAYNYLTQFDSPNYTPAAETTKVWGVARNIIHIDIHHWGDPAQHPTFEGVISTLCNPSAQRSAHFVATGNGRRVACLISPQDNSWATVQDNPYSISIECDPQWDDATYDVVGELIADIRSAYGAGLELHQHSEFFPTQCAGGVDLNRLNQIAANKVSQAQWGQVTDKNAAPTVNADTINQDYQDLLGRGADADGLNHYLALAGQGWSNDQIRADLQGSTEYRQRQNALAAANAAAVATATPVDKQPHKDNPYVRFPQAMSLVANKQPTDVFDTSQLDPSTAIVKKLNQGDPFLAVGKFNHPNGSVYFMTAYSFGQADTTGLVDHPYGVNTVDLSPAPEAPATTAPAEAVQATTPVVPAPAPAPAPAADNGTAIPVNVIPPDPNKWQQSFTPHGNGKYIASQSLVIRDLSGANAPLQLVRGQTVDVAGTFTKDGVDYYITQNSIANKRWYGIPVQANGYPVIVEDDSIFSIVLQDEQEALHKAVNSTKNKVIKTIASIDGFINHTLHK